MSKKISKYLYVPKDKHVRIRFVGHQEEMFQYFSKSYFNSVASNPTVFTSSASQSASKSKEDYMFFREEDNGDNAFTRSKRVVSLVIDRDDDLIKAFACPIMAWNKITEHSPDNDFEIWREGSGLNTRYFVKPHGLSEVAKNHESIITATLASYTFKDIFVDNKWDLVGEIVEKIKNRWQILDL